MGYLERRTTMKKVLILGSRGMLATEMARVFLSDDKIETYIVGRHFSDLSVEKSQIFKVLEDKPLFPGFDYIINCVGVIKPHIDEKSYVSSHQAIFINSIFPSVLRSLNPNATIIQIATDCVYSGKTGLYFEDAPHDALDVYGKTKSLGEVRAAGFYNIRTSIIGHEPYNKKSLLEWFLSQPEGAELKGFTNHMWNGITTTAFAKVCLALVQRSFELPNFLHLTPADFVSKFELLHLLAAKFHKNVKITPTEAPEAVNRVLASRYKDIGLLWKLAGYDGIPSIRSLIQEL
jgi:dTDP-4-dehydrorhamnose reductase